MPTPAVWRTEDHADDEAVYRVGFTLGQDTHYDIAWCAWPRGQTRMC